MVAECDTDTGYIVTTDGVRNAHLEDIKNLVTSSVCDTSKARCLGRWQVPVPDIWGLPCPLTTASTSQVVKLLLLHGSRYIMTSQCLHLLTINHHLFLPINRSLTLLRHHTMTNLHTICRGHHPCLRQRTATRARRRSHARLTRRLLHQSHTIKVDICSSLSGLVFTSLVSNGKIRGIRRQIRTRILKNKACRYYWK